MAENINISFAPNKAASDTQRITDLEQYVSTLTERTKFAFASVIEDYGESGKADDNAKIINMIYQTACEAVSVGVPCGDGSSVWFNILTDSDQPGTNVDSNISYSCIGGRLNQAHAQCFAVDIFGEGNTAYASSFSSISGQNNTVGGDMHSTISGMKNTATYTARCIISGNGNKVADSDGSVVSGQQNTVTGNFSAVIANNAEVSGNDNIVVGEKHTVNGDMNAVFGNNNTVEGSKNTASGDGNNITDDGSVVLGTSNTAKNGSSYVVGGSNEVTGMNFVYGFSNTVNGGHNIAMGENLKIDNSDDINSYSQTAIGTYMDTEQLEGYNGRWRFVIADGNYDNPHNLIYAIEDADGKRKLYFGCDIDLPSASDTALGAVKAGENISISADGTISVDLSAYLKSADISDWAKADEKPAYTASEIGLGNVDNTADKDKPISTATQTALDGKASIAHKHTVSDITDMPTKLPANGGNADTVGGKHASDFAAAKHTHTAAEVGAATSADITAAISAVEIGGRNLLYNSKFDKKYPTGWAYSADVTYAFDNEVTTLTKTETATRQFTTQASVSNGVVVANPNLLPENGCTYTISCEVMKAEGYDVGEGTKVTARYNYTDGTVKDYDVDVSGASETVWTKYSSTYTYASDKTVRYTQFIVALGAQACGIKIRNVKFEKGNKPTDWTPALEELATTEYVEKSISSALGVGLTRDNVTVTSDESILGIDVNSTTVKQKLAVKNTASMPYVTEAVFENTTYGDASTRQSGLMSAEDKSKLIELEERVAALEAKLVNDQ